MPRRPGRYASSSVAGLFADAAGGEALASGIHLWRGVLDERAYLDGIAVIAAAAPFRSMMTPGGRPMSVAMSNCGALGWISDAAGYRYSTLDPASGRPWPAIPEAWLADAARLATGSGYPDFRPDACLINRYAVGARMTAHQDRNEADFSQPIVSLSLGLPATFAFHGPSRTGRATTVELASGDALVWGGEARLFYHAVRPVRAGSHPLAGAFRYNITMRRAAHQ